MKFFQQLNHGDAVETKDGKNLLIALHPGEYVIQKEDSIQNEFDILGYSQSEVMISKEESSNLYRKIKKPKKVLYYVHKDRPEDRKDVYEKDELFSRHHNWELDEYEYSSLEEEYGHRKEMQEFDDNWIPIYNDEDFNLEKINVIIRGKFEDTGSDFIASPIVQGQLSWQGDFIYRVNSGKIARDEFNKAVKEFGSENFEISKTSNILYTKFQGKYIFSAFEKIHPWLGKEDSITLCLALDKAKTTEKEIREFIRKIIHGHLEPIENLDMSITELVIALRQTLNSLSSVQTVKSGNSSSNLTRSKNILSELLEKLSKKT